MHNGMQADIHCVELCFQFPGVIMLFSVFCYTFFFAEHGKLFLIQRLDGKSASK